MRIRIELKVSSVANGKTKIWRKFARSVLLLLVLVFKAEAQQPECLFVQFDKSFYVSGETVWFKVYALNDSGNVKSRVLHVDLVNHKNETVVKQKLLIDNRTSDGSITLPIKSEEGNYRFTAYTTYNLNFKPASIYEKIIPIFQPNKEDVLHSDQRKQGMNQLRNAGGISIGSDKEIYRPRDSLTVTFQINESIDAGRGNFSVSIVPFEIANLEFETHNHSKCADLGFDAGQRIEYQRSLFIEGSLQHPNTKLNVSSRLITIYMDKASRLIKAFSNEGKIKIPVYDYWGPGIFQILNLDPHNPSDFEFITVSESRSVSPYYNSDPPVRTPIVIKYMEQLEKRSMVDELFGLNKSRKIVHPTVSAMVPDAIYQAKDYKEIYSLEEFINEAIFNVKVRTTNGIKTVKLFNKEEGDLFEDHPWYIVDGFLTYDEEEVLNIPYQDMVEVRLYSKTSTIRQYFEHFMWRSGVMEIVTQDVKYARKLRNSPNVVEIDGFSAKRNFNSEITVPESEATPDLRGVIYWSTTVSTNEQGWGQITIPLSDDTGKFAIVVMGTTNFRKPLTGDYFFEVKLE